MTIQPLNGTSRPITLAAANPDWRASANCATVDPGLFFPEGGDGSRSQVRDARRVCRNCLVQTECLNWALETKPEAGVWAGTTERQRRGRQPGAGAQGATR